MFHFIQWTWGLPQNILGLILLPFFRGERYRYHSALVTVYRGMKKLTGGAGFSLGSFIFIPDSWSDYDKSHIVVHEYGHTVQSLILGPFYLFVVAVPSVIWSKMYSKHYKKYKSLGIAYTDRFPENSADRLGERATGDSVK